MELSIVIPALNESSKITTDIEAASVFLTTNNICGEIIVVDDGSEDNTTEAAEKTGSALPLSVKLVVIRIDNNRGKGYAVRTGMKATTGEYIMFADSGCCVPYSNVMDGLKLLKNGICDITHGSRKLKESSIQKGQSWYRRICSSAFHLFVIHSMKIPSELTDTQCGFKIYKGQIGRELFNQCITDGFMFDIEIIMRANKAGFRIKEFPIQWTCDRDSRLSPARSFRQVLSELKAIKRAVRGKQ